MNETCQHGLKISEVDESSDVNTYCAECFVDALWSGELGLSMGMKPDHRRKLRNKEKAKRRAARHG